MLKAGSGTPASTSPETLSVVREDSLLTYDLGSAAIDLFTELLEGGEESTVNEALFQRHGLELIWLAFANQKTKIGLEAVSEAKPSKALLRQVSKPEYRKIAQAIGLQFEK